jgi:hypothetical protein
LILKGKKSKYKQEHLKMDTIYTVKMTGSDYHRVLKLVEKDQKHRDYVRTAKTPHSTGGRVKPIYMEVVGVEAVPMHDPSMRSQINIIPQQQGMTIPQQQDMTIPVQYNQQYQPQQQAAHQY